jgi:hypothetical protein
MGKLQNDDDTGSQASSTWVVPKSDQVSSNQGSFVTDNMTGQRV